MRDPWGENIFRCEECKHHYETDSTWKNERVCAPCMRGIMRAIGEKPMDAGLDADDRQYLEDTFGVPIEDEDHRDFGQDCRSCVEHPQTGMRDLYPCLRDPGDVCGFQVRMERWRRAQQYGTGNTIFYGTNTSSATTIYTNTYYFRSTGTGNGWSAT